MIRKVVVRDILIIHVNIAVHAKPKSCAETVVRINQRINVVYVPSVHCTAWILQRISVLLKQNRHMYVMAAASFLNAPCKNAFMIRQMLMRWHISLFRNPERAFYPMRMI